MINILQFEVYAGNFNIADTNIFMNRSEELSTKIKLLLEFFYFFIF
jgi:hypothetical protein